MAGFLSALKRHSVPRRHQMIDAPVSLNRRRGRRRRLASSLPYGVTTQLLPAVLAASRSHCAMHRATTPLACALCAILCMEMSPGQRTRPVDEAQLLILLTNLCRKVALRTERMKSALDWDSIAALLRTYHRWQSLSPAAFPQYFTPTSPAPSA